MAHRIYRVIKSDELDRAVELGYGSGVPSDIDPSLSSVMNDNDDNELKDLTVPEKTSMFDGWDEFPFGSHAQFSELTQDPRWSKIKDKSKWNRKWATRP